MWRSLKEKNYSKFEFIDHYDKRLLPCSLLRLSQLYSGNQPADCCRERLILVLSILDIEIIYAAKGKMIPPEKPPIPMQTCRYSWNMTTTDRKSQEKIRNFLKGKTQKYKII